MKERTKKKEIMKMNRTVRGSQRKNNKTNTKKKKQEKRKNFKMSDCTGLLGQVCSFSIHCCCCCCLRCCCCYCCCTHYLYDKISFFFVALELKQIQLYSLCLFTYFKWQTMLRYAIVYRTAGTLPYIFNGTDKISLKL